MADFTIEVVKEQHFIEGDRFHAFLHQGEGEHRRTVVLAVNVKPDEYFNLTENLGGIKTRLELLGNTVKTKFKEDPDPNFATREEADEYLMNN